MFDASSIHRFHAFADRNEWARVIAADLALDLKDSLAGAGEASLIVPGGRTPAPVFAELAKADLPWPRVQVCPTDERWVPPDHPDSNERSIVIGLIGKGAAARLRSLWRDASRPSSGLPEVERAIAAMPRPFASVLIGMGEDGHFASLFPGSPEASVGLDIDCRRSCIAIDTPQKGYPRISLTLAALTDARAVRLAITGRDKRDVLASAMGRADSTFPVTRLLAQTLAPVHAYWTP